MRYCYPGSHLSNNIFTVPARLLVMNFFSVQSSAEGINHSTCPLALVECCWKIRRSICFILPFSLRLLPDCRSPEDQGQSLCIILFSTGASTVLCIELVTSGCQHSQIQPSWNCTGILPTPGISLLTPMGMGEAGEPCAP